MAYLRSCFENLPLNSRSLLWSRTAVFSALFLATFTCLAQDSAQNVATSEPPPQPDARQTVTLPSRNQAGARPHAASSDEVHSPRR